MLQKNETDKIVTFHLSKKGKKLQTIFNATTASVTVRLVVIELADGHKEILCTSLINKEACPPYDLKQLYHLRWEIEEAYKLYEARANMETFFGMPALSIKQDFYAVILPMNLCAMISFPIEQKVRQERRKRQLKYTKTVNKTNAFSLVREAMAGVFIKKKVKQFYAP